MKKNTPTILSLRNSKTVTLHKKKKRKASSTRWLNRQLNDVYVNSAKEEGYYARSAYKLIEINQKFNLFKHGSYVIDLGAAPGGWSQVAAKLINGASKSKNNSPRSGKIIAVDLLDTKPLPGNVITIKGDFLSPSIVSQILEALDGCKPSIIISDMAPNTTGNKDLDHLKIVNLLEAVINFTLEVLATGGSLVAKVFQGGLENELLKTIKTHFKEVKHFKPLSSRKESKEIYLVAKGFKGLNLN